MQFRINDFDTRVRLPAGTARQRVDSTVEVLTKAEAGAKHGWVEPPPWWGYLHPSFTAGNALGPFRVFAESIYGGYTDWHAWDRDTRRQTFLYWGGVWGVELDVARPVSHIQIGNNDYLPSAVASFDLLARQASGDAWTVLIPYTSMPVVPAFDAAFQDREIELPTITAAYKQFGIKPRVTVGSYVPAAMNLAFLGPNPPNMSELDIPVLLHPAFTSGDTVGDFSVFAVGIYSGSYAPWWAWDYPSARNCYLSGMGSTDPQGPGYCIRLDQAQSIDEVRVGGNRDYEPSRVLTFALDARNNDGEQWTNVVDNIATGLTTVNETKQVVLGATTPAYQQWKVRPITTDGYFPAMAHLGLYKYLE